MANLNFDFQSFDHLDEQLEQAALDILSNDPAEIVQVHISDKELEAMADQILVKEEKRSFLTKVAVGAVAFIPAAILSFTIGAGVMAAIHSQPISQPSQCTIYPDGDCF